MSRDTTTATGGDLATLRTAAACRRGHARQLWRDAGRTVRREAAAKAPA